MTEASQATIIVASIMMGGSLFGVLFQSVVKNRADIEANKHSFQKQLDDRLKMILDDNDKEITQLRAEIAMTETMRLEFVEMQTHLLQMKRRVKQMEEDLAAEIERRKIAVLSLDVADIQMDATKTELRRVNVLLTEAQKALDQERGMVRQQAHRIEDLERLVCELEAEVGRLKSIDIFETTNGANI